MQQLYANQAASISELKKNPSKLINSAEGNPVVILNHNVAAAYLVPAHTYEVLIDLLDDIDLGKIVKQRLADKKKSIRVNIDDL
jgi:antitoxin StbD